jgi:hypothetical protein
MLRRSKWMIPAMVARWDAILLATVLAGGAVLIENNHRLDMGAPDEEVVATSTCDAVAAERYAWKPLTLPAEDANDAPDTAQAPYGCTSD